VVVTVTVNVTGVCTYAFAFDVVKVVAEGAPEMCCTSEFEPVFWEKESDATNETPTMIAPTVKLDVVQVAMMSEDDALAGTMMDWENRGTPGLFTSTYVVKVTRPFRAA
jgi:hypothetical protein